MAIVFDREGEVVELVGSIIGLHFVPPYVAVGFERNGELIGGAIFNVYTGADIELSLAGNGILTRSAMKSLAHYAFLQAGCRRVSMTVRASNYRVHRLASRCGFKMEGVKRRGYRDEDAFIYGLLPEDFPWLKIEVNNG